MMVDILSGVLLGVPAGKHVSSMYHDLSEGRRLGHLNVAINPEFFCGADEFRAHMSEVLDELNAVKPGVGFDKVYWPGQRAQMRIQATKDAGGIEIVDDIYDYLVSDDLYRHSLGPQEPLCRVARSRVRGTRCAVAMPPMLAAAGGCLGDV